MSEQIASLLRQKIADSGLSAHHLAGLIRVGEQTLKEFSVGVKHRPVDGSKTRGLLWIDSLRTIQMLVSGLLDLPSVG